VGGKGKQDRGRDHKSNKNMRRRALQGDKKRTTVQRELPHRGGVGEDLKRNARGRDSCHKFQKANSCHQWVQRTINEMKKHGSESGLGGNQLTPKNRLFRGREKNM